MSDVTEAQIRQDLAYLYRPELQKITDEHTQPFEERLIDFIVSEAKRQAAAMATQMAGTTLRYIKAGVDVAATSNIDLEGIQAVDGVPGALEMVVGVVGQTNKAQNGPWIMKDGPWVRLPGFATPAELSGIAFYVNQGSTQAGNRYEQPLKLTSASDAKEFVQTSNANEALRSLAGSLKTEEDKESVTITGTTTLETIDGAEVEVFTPDSSYQIKNKVGNFELKQVYLRQPTSEIEIDEGDDWTYNPETGELKIEPAALVNYLEGHKIRLKLETTGTFGLAYGIDFEYLSGIPGTNLGFRYLNETRADARPIEGANLTINAGLDTITYAVTNITNGFIITHNKGTTEVSIEAVASNGKPDRSIYASHDGPQRIKVYVPPGVPFTGKIRARFYPEAISL